MQRYWNEEHRRWYQYRLVYDSSTGQWTNRWCEEPYVDSSARSNDSIPAQQSNYAQSNHDAYASPRHTVGYGTTQHPAVIGPYTSNTGQYSNGAYNYSVGVDQYQNSGHSRETANSNLYSSTQRSRVNSHQPDTNASTASTLPRGVGTTITTSQPSTLQDQLDPAFRVQPRSFFFEGRVLAVVLNENVGQNAMGYNSSVSEVRYSGNYVYSQTRRFIVVRTKREFCFACPIFTYSGRATTKPGVRAEEHGIAYSWGQEAKLVRGESGITKASMPVVMEANEKNLDVASRIYYGIHHPIQYNVKVKAIGYVPPNYVHFLIGNWRAESEGTTEQAIEVTANAFRTDGGSENNLEDVGQEK